MTAIDLVAAAKIACGSCRACCIGELVLLQPGEDPAAYGARPARNPLTGEPGFALPQKPGKAGECAFLGPKGCTIYDRRPKVCRAFDCGDWWERAPRDLKRAMRASPGKGADLEAAGRRVALGRRKAEGER